MLETRVAFEARVAAFLSENPQAPVVEVPAAEFDRRVEQLRLPMGVRVFVYEGKDAYLLANHIFVRASGD